MVEVYFVLALVWSILCLILFFKVWGMTNDIREIKKYLLSDILVSPTAHEKDSSKKKNIKEGDIVINKKTGEEMIVKNIYSNGVYGCDTGKIYPEDFTINDIEVKD
jgi:hypothetical protein